MMFPSSISAQSRSGYCQTTFLNNAVVWVAQYRSCTLSSTYFRWSARGKGIFAKQGIRLQVSGQNCEEGCSSERDGLASSCGCVYFRRGWQYGQDVCVEGRKSVYFLWVKGEERIRRRRNKERLVRIMECFGL